MLRVLSNWRCVVVLTLAMFAFLFMVGEPYEDCEYWFSVFFIHKTVAVILALVAYRLFKHWDKKGLLSELNEFVKEEDL